MTVTSIGPWKFTVQRNNTGQIWYAYFKEPFDNGLVSFIIDRVWSNYYLVPDKNTYEFSLKRAKISSSAGIVTESGYDVTLFTTLDLNAATSVPLQATQDGDVILWAGFTKGIGFSNWPAMIAEAALYPNIKYAYVYDEMFWSGSGISIGLDEPAILTAAAQAHAVGLKTVVTILPDVILDPGFVLNTPNEYDVIAIDVYPLIRPTALVGNYPLLYPNILSDLLYSSIQILRGIGFTGEIWYIYQAFGLHSATDAQMTAAFDLQLETLGQCQAMGVTGIVPFGFWLGPTEITNEPNLFQGAGTIFESQLRYPITTPAAIDPTDFRVDLSVITEHGVVVDPIPPIHRPMEFVINDITVEGGYDYGGFDQNLFDEPTPSFTQGYPIGKVKKITQSLIPGNLDYYAFVLNEIPTRGTYVELRIEENGQLNPWINTAIKDDMYLQVSWVSGATVDTVDMYDWTPFDDHEYDLSSTTILPGTNRLIHNINLPTGLIYEEPKVVNELVIYHGRNKIATNVLVEHLGVPITMTTINIGEYFEGTMLPPDFIGVDLQRIVINLATPQTIKVTLTF